MTRSASWTRATCVALVFGCLVPIAGCESTQDKSARLAKHGSAPFKQKGLRIDRTSATVKVASTAVVSDSNGSAVVVDMRNESPRAIAGIPLAINVLDARGKSVYKNDVPGLDAALTGASSLGPQQQLAWVDDQVNAPGGKRVSAVVGAERGVPPGPLPRITLTSAKLVDDPTSGVNASGIALNGSNIEQDKLVVYAVARKAGRVVAAGRAGIPRLKAHGKEPYHVFFIGDPRGAQLTLAAPPTAFR